MREKRTRRWLSLLLTVVMVLSLVPATALAAYFGAPVKQDLGLEKADAIGTIGETLAGSMDTTATDGGEFYKIVHLDCGRKYFSPESIKTIIDNAAAAGFNQVELYLSDNQGFRFALDDMEVTTSTGKTYDLTPALGDGYSDGLKYPDYSGKYLTQEEMTNIISYATGKDIEIVPCINVPGHMGAILEAFTDFRYSTSQSSIDLENEEAVAFALAITAKYAEYFAGQGVKYYNLGADEYANDMSTMGFQGLYTSGKYQEFVDFLNSAAQIVIDNGMTPRAFNDGICYNNDTGYDINKAIQVCYWSSGWQPYYNVASAATLKGAGYDLINTHGDYYWVLGNSTWQCSADKASGFDYTAFQGGTIISDPAGAMFCIWCDVGNANGQDDGAAVVSATAPVIAAFGTALPGGTTVDPDPVAIPGAPDSLTVGGTATLSVGEAAEWTSSNEAVIQLSAAVATAAVSGTSSVLATAVGAGTAIITAKTQSRTYTADITVQADGGDGDVTETKTITVSVGGYAIDNIVGANNANNVERKDLDTAIATVEVTGQEATDATTNYTQKSAICNDLISSNSTNWKAVSGYYYKASDGNYYPLYAKRSKSGKNYAYTWGYSTNSSASAVTQIGTQEKASTSTAVDITVYTKEDIAAVPAFTTVTFAGVSEGTTYVTVGNTHYTIKVVAENLNNVAPLTVEYWITNMQVTAGNETSTSISAQSVYDEAGVDLSTLVPESGSYTYGSVVFWKGTVLDANNKQTDASGVENDKTGAGKDFSKLRYYQGNWQYFYEEDGTWNTISSTDQVVAYWLQPTEVTKEITTLVKDWGYAPNGQGNDDTNKVALTVAVVYPDGTVSPAEGNMYSTSTTLFNYWNNRDIGLVAPINNSDYEISKITVTVGKRDNSSTGKWGTSETITWEKVTNEADEQWYNETTYWEEADGGTPMVNGATDGIIWSNYNTAKLVLIYLKPVHYDTNLEVKWVDDSAGGAEISTMEIAVSSDGTPITFYNGLKQTSDLPPKDVGGTFTLDDDAYVKNSSNVNQTFNKNISTIPNVADQYKSGLYKYVRAELSADGMTLTLHYDINNSKLTKTYVLDFGLDVAVPLSDLVNNVDDVKAVEISSRNAAAKYDKTVQKIVVTPTGLPQGTVTVKVMLTIGSETKTFTVGFIPASNVLYEDNFLSQLEEDGSRKDWTTNPVSGITENQTAGTNTEDNYVYGYDPVYENSNGLSGNSATVAVESGVGSKALSTSFYGNGFDVIGDCGADTATVYVVIKQDAKAVKGAIVDTRYKELLHQVPLAHLTFAEGTYTAEIRAFYSKPVTGSTSNPGIATASLFGGRSLYSETDSSGLDDVMAAVMADGLALEDVELVYFDSASPLAAMGGVSAVSTLALDADTTPAAAVSRGEGTKAVIDGFRVYRSSDNAAYKADEQNVTYVNVLDAVTDSFAAYVEGDATGTNWTKETYESNGGPQNEIYLNANQSSAVTFKLEGVMAGTTVQISARAVSGSANLNGKSQISSNTEMYYTVTVGKDGVVAITNNGEGMLAIGNLKLPADASVAVEMTEDDLQIAYAMLRTYAASAPVEPDEPETPVFQPAKLDLRVTSANFFARKVVTLSITASSDVARLTVNGKEVKPTNALLVKWGLAKNYQYVVTDTVSRNATANFEVVAYDANGVASEVYVKQG